jgi:FAD synthase
MTEENALKTKDLVPGVYSAIATLYGRKLKCAMSIGWNPVYDNPEKTIEAYLIDDTLEEFYGEHLLIEVKAFIRAEALFSDFDSLI